MITKTAVTAWKLMMPYLGEDAQHVLARNMRKPMAAYNAAVEKGSQDIAKKYNIDIDRFTTNNDLNDLLQNTMLYKTQYGYHRNSRRVLNGIYYDVLNNPAFKKDLKKQLIAERHNIKPYKKLLKDVNTARGAIPDNYSAVFAPVPLATARHGYTHNIAMRHELSEGAHTLNAEKKGILLAKPQVSSGAMHHASVDVLKDELKGLLRSGYFDVQFNPKLDIPILRARNQNRELNGLLTAGKNSGSVLGGRYYKDAKTTGNIKKMQTKFFNNLHRKQQAKNVHIDGPITDEMRKNAPTYYLD